MKQKTLVIGVGNDFRGDDAAGLEAVRRLWATGSFPADLEEWQGDGVGLLSLWEDYPAVVVVDAVSSGSAPGTLYRFNPLIEPLPSQFFKTSTHNFGVAEAIELARSLSLLPSSLVILGIEGEQFEIGQMLSATVEKSLPELMAKIRAELAS